MSANCVPAITVPSPPVKTVALGVKIDLITPAKLLDLVTDCISAQRKVIIAHHNLHSLLCIAVLPQTPSCFVASMSGRTIRWLTVCRWSAWQATGATHQRSTQGGIQRLAASYAASCGRERMADILLVPHPRLPPGAKRCCGLGIPGCN